MSLTFYLVFYLYFDLTMLLMAQHLYDCITNYRVVQITGRYGARKTSLAVRLAHHYWHHHNYRAVSNFTLSFNSWSSSSPLGDFKKTIILLDEAGVIFSTMPKGALAMLRKVDCVYILSTVQGVKITVPYVDISRVFDFTLLSIPLVVYRYKIRNIKDKVAGLFYWVMPSEVYGTYRTTDVVNDDQGIIKNFAKYVSGLSAGNIEPGPLGDGQEKA